MSNDMAVNSCAERPIQAKVTYFLAGDCPCIRYSAQVSNGDLRVVVVEIKDKMPFNTKTDI